MTVRIRTDYEDGRYTMGLWRGWKSYTEISWVEWWAYRLYRKIDSWWQRRLQRLDNAQFETEHPP